MLIKNTKENWKTKNSKGITLVALVITIIVLLILAGVSISLVVGQNGVLGKATNAVNANEKAIVEQEIKLSIEDAQMAYYVAWTTNQSVGKGKFFGSIDYYKNNCISSATNGIIIELGSGVNNDSNSGEITIKYKTKSNVYYTYKFNIQNPENLIYVSGPTNN